MSGRIRALCALLGGLIALSLPCAAAGAEALGRGVLVPGMSDELTSDYGMDEGYYNEAEYEIGDGPRTGRDVLGNDEIDRGEIAAIYFLDSLSSAPAWAWDASANGDRSVLAWTDGEELYVAADGGVIANPNSSYLFANYSGLAEVDFGGRLDTSRVQDMSGMFYNCYALEELDLSDFDTSEVTNMADMFSDCYALRKLDLSSFDARRVEDMSFMFYRANSLVELDLSSFETPELREMSWMFSGCYALAELNLERFDTSRIDSYDSVFEGCTEGLDILVGEKFKLP